MFIGKIQTDSQKVTSIQPNRVTAHPSYNDISFDNDAIVFKLQRKVDYGILPNVYPACWPTRKPKKGENVRIWSTALRIRSCVIFCHYFLWYSDGWLAGTVASYCPSRSSELMKENLTQYGARSDAQRCTLYVFPLILGEIHFKFQRTDVTLGKTLEIFFRIWRTWRNVFHLVLGGNTNCCAVANHIQRCVKWFLHVWKFPTPV